MKRTFFAILMIVCCASGFAQTRKVAILETVDRQKQVTYGVKLMLRSYLAEAITNTTGYEAYDRTDLSAIIDEQEFQRTGYVSDEEIKKIGQMTGVQYILVAEASKIDEHNLFVTAKILNVETARMEMTANLMTKNDVTSLQQGAKDLASRLLIIKDEPLPAAEEYIVSKAIIERISSNEYKLGDRWLTRKEYYTFINDRNRCVPAYQKFQQGLKLEKAGKWTAIAGAGMLLVGTLTLAIGMPVNVKYVEVYSGSNRPESQKVDGVYVSEYSWERNSPISSYWHAYVRTDAYYNCEIAGSVLMGVGGGVAITGFSIWAGGVAAKNNAYKAYNKSCAEPLTFNLLYKGNGIGLALNF